jgi:hypothetical protein
MGIVFSFQVVERAKKGDRLKGSKEGLAFGWGYLIDMGADI